jgi:hypothetical protein
MGKVSDYLKIKIKNYELLRKTRSLESGCPGRGIQFFTTTCSK